MLGHLQRWKTPKENRLGEKGVKFTFGHIEFEVPCTTARSDVR